MELVEPASAVVEKGGAWQGFLPYQTKWYAEVESLAGVNIGGTGLVRCTPALSVSSVTSESYRPNDLCHQHRNYRGNPRTIDLPVP